MNSFFRKLTDLALLATISATLHSGVVFCMHQELSKDLEMSGVFHKDADRSAAEGLLLNKKIGSFLIRNSSIEGRLVISSLQIKREFVGKESIYLPDLDQIVNQSPNRNSLRFGPTNIPGYLEITEVVVIHDLLDISEDGKKVSHSDENNFVDLFSLLESGIDYYKYYTLTQEAAERMEKFHAGELLTDIDQFIPKTR